MLEVFLCAAFLRCRKELAFVAETVNLDFGEWFRVFTAYSYVVEGGGLSSRQGKARQGRYPVFPTRNRNEDHYRDSQCYCARNIP